MLGGPKAHRKTLNLKAYAEYCPVGSVPHPTMSGTERPPRRAGRSDQLFRRGLGRFRFPLNPGQIASSITFWYQPINWASPSST